MDESQFRPADSGNPTERVNLTKPRPLSGGEVVSGEPARPGLSQEVTQLQRYEPRSYQPQPYHPQPYQPPYHAQPYQPPFPSAQPQWVTASPTIVSDRKSANVQVVVSWILTVLTLGYFLPWAVAATRGKSNALAVGLLNFFVGWTVIGWIISLVMACASHQVVVAASVMHQAYPPYPPQPYRQ